MTTLQETIIVLIFFTIWCISLYHRTYDKYIKNRLMPIGILIVFWMLIKILKTVFNTDPVEDLMWYAYYIPLIIVPTLYYLISKYIYNKQQPTKKNYILICISSLLIIMVLTNNLHQFAFSIPDDNGNYIYNAGYYIVCLWIFSLLIISTVLLIISKNRRKKELKTYIIFLPIVLGVVYTVLYVKGASIVKHSNMSVIASLLICAGLEPCFF